MLPALLALSACQGQDGYGIKGVIKNAANMQIQLDQSHFDRSNTNIGKATSNADGQFDISLEKPLEEGLYRLSFGAKKMYFIINGKETKIELNGDLNTIDRMEVTVKGSETFDCYAKLINGLLKEQLKSADEAKAFIERGCTPLMKAFLTMQLLGGQAPSFMAEFKQTGKNLEAAMPGSKYVGDFNTILTQLEQAGTQQMASEKIKVGEDAPEIMLADPSGKTRKLSSLRGKVVLLDFWASWCGPCRRENPHVVEVYKKYNSKGFEIFSVSLDGVDPRQKLAPEAAKQQEEAGKQKWIAAIKQDGLLWENHVSDLKHWGSEPAALYGVTSIPKTFLIGRDGKIVAINPRQNLEEALQKAL